MRQYVDRFAVANTVRMTQSLRGGSPVALVERDADVREVDECLGPYDSRAIPAYSRENLLGAVALLTEGGWAIVCARVTGGIPAPQERPVPLRELPWFASMSEEFAQSVGWQRSVPFCLVVLPASGDEPAEAMPGPEPAVSSKHRQHSGADPWNQQNEQRVSLIQKRHRHGLTSDEQNELDGLQAEMSARINAVRPLPFDALEKLERYVDEAERRLSGKP